MSNLNNKVILDVKVGSVIKEYSEDKVILVGTYYQKGSNFVENVEIVIDPECGDGLITTKVEYAGYKLELFLGDFNNDGLDEIMLRGEYGGSGGYAIASIYQFKDGKLKEIFSPEMFSEKYSFTAEYLPDKKVKVSSIPLKEKFIFCIDNKPKIYLDMIYDKNGKVKYNVTPTVSAINDAFPIKSIYSDNPYLFIRQRVIGVSNADTIGYIESFVNLADNNIMIFNIGIFNFGEKEEEEIKEKLLGKRIISYMDEEEEDYSDINPYSFKEEINEVAEKLIEDKSINTRCIKTMDSIFIDFYSPYINKNYLEDYEEFKSRDDLNNKENINKEINNSKSRLDKVTIPENIRNKFPIETEFLLLEELKENRGVIRTLSKKKEENVLVPYLLDKKPYLALLKKEYGSYVLKHNFRGEGINVKDLFVLKVGKETFVFIGFAIDDELNKLYILKIKDGKLVKAFKENEYYYNKVYLKNLKNNKEYQIVIWTKEIEDAYKVNIYNIKEYGMKKTDKYDKEYYKEMVDYYEKLIENNVNPGITSYFLALAYERVGEYKKALDVINKALEQESPYPSVERLKELREKLNKEMVDYYEKLIENNVNPGINSYFLALAYERVGEYKKALDVINKALEQESPYPSVERLKELREKLKKLVK
ncbi:hypothetical protein FHH43_14715 [Clostridium perfringens]|nr:hypothetical protein [Clostridium perfringens]